MAETFDVFEPTGALIGAIPISPQQRAQLHAGQTIIISFHTPRMLREAMPVASGQFEVTELEGKLIALNGDQVKRYIEMQGDIAKAMQDPRKWTDPDAKSDDPVR
jgi:hypothetical protein